MERLIGCRRAEEGTMYRAPTAARAGTGGIRL